MKKILSILVLTMASAFLVGAQENHLKKTLNVENIWKNFEFYGSSVSGFKSMKDGESYTRFEWKQERKSIVKYTYQNRNQNGTILLDGKDIVFDGKELNVDDYEFNEDESKLLLLVNKEQRYRRSFYAEYYLYDLHEKTLVPLDPERSPQTLASYSPDGTKVAYIYKNNIYVKDILKNKVKQITKDGEENKIINGTTDWVYEEEFAYTKAYDWSPNSEYIAYLRFDESDVPEFTMMYFRDLYPEPYTFKYPKTGDNNSIVELKVANLKSGKSTHINLGEYEYIPRIKFSAQENKLIALTLNRHQNHLQYHWIDVLNKSMPATLVYEEEDEAYVEIDDNLDFLNDGKHFIRTSEKDGYNHIYKIGIDGSSFQITKGDWDVISYEGINEEKGLIYYLSAEEGPQYSTLYSIRLDGSNKRKISTQKGTNQVTFSTGMKYFINRWSDINTPQTYTLYTAEGELVEVLEDNEFLNQHLKELNFQPKHFITVPGATKDLNAWILYPPDFDSTKTYPVYLYVYGGPGSNTVKDSYDGGNGAYHQLLAQKGYIVMSVDPRGTQFRGAEFKKCTYLQLGKYETEDFIAVAQHIKKWDFVDPDRIGIMGWSYGGYMASLAITKGADDFKMAIAVAPVTNWRYYDNIYTERFMRTPQENAQGYDDNSPIFHVDKLKGNYFIIHGSGDDNVHVQNTMEMINALVEADKDFTMFIYPNKNHGIYGGNARNHLYRMMLEYTLKNL